VPTAYREAIAKPRFPGAAREFHPPREGEGCERSERGGVTLRKITHLTPTTLRRAMLAQTPLIAAEAGIQGQDVLVELLPRPRFRWESGLNYLPGFGSTFMNQSAICDPVQNSTSRFLRIFS